MLITPNLWNFQRVLNTLAATQEVPRHTRFQSRGSTRVPPTSRGAPFPLHSSRGGIHFLCGRERIPGDPVASQVEALTTERREELLGRATIPRVPQMLSPSQGNQFSLHCLDFQAEDRHSPRTAEGTGPRGDLAELWTPGQKDVLRPLQYLLPLFCSPH